MVAKSSFDPSVLQRPSATPLVPRQDAQTRGHREATARSLHDADPDAARSCSSCSGTGTRSSRLRFEGVSVLLQAARALHPGTGRHACNFHSPRAPYQYQTMAAAVSVGGPYSPSAMASPSYHLPPMGNARTKSDLINIDQFLEQMQATVYESDDHVAAAGVAQPGATFVHGGLSSAPPTRRPRSCHPAMPPRPRRPLP